MELYEMSAARLSTMMAKGDCTSLEITKAVFSRIREKEDEIGAYITLCEESALKTADDIDKRRKKGEKLPVLAGIPLAVKDNICTAGMRTTCASKMLENFVSPYDATVIERAKTEGLVIIGKTNMDEFAMGSSCENSAFKTTKNPIDTSRTAGGSSGGSAAAVAVGETVLALGSDTGGSVRQPAAMCGIVGLKPTYGSVSRYGLVAFASSLDQIGPMGRTVLDTAMLFKAVCGHDRRDATSIDREYPEFMSAMGRGVMGLRIGLPEEYFTDAVSEEARENVLMSAKALEKEGAVIKKVSLPMTDKALAAYYVIACAEASSNLARYDGVKYGFSAKDCKTISELYKKSRSEGFGDEVKRRIMLGTMVLSSGYNDKFYKRALFTRQSIIDDFKKAFMACDVILTPTTPETAFLLGQNKEDPVKMYAADICTVAANIAGIPAISIPCGCDKNGLPIGLQLMGPHFSEDVLFNLADHLEKLCLFERGRAL